MVHGVQSVKDLTVAMKKSIGSNLADQIRSEFAAFVFHRFMLSK